VQKIQWKQFLNRLSFYNVRRGVKYLKQNGLGELVTKITERFQKEEINYEEWFEEHKVTKEELEVQRQTIFSYSPQISIVVPVYKPPVDFLCEMIESVMAQSYKNWELCLVDADTETEETTRIIQTYKKQDSRIKYKKVAENAGISQNTNKALKLITGEYVGFLDHDDLLAPNALFEIAAALNHNQNIDVIYTDEDKLREKKHFGANFKSDFNLEFLRANNYICHFLVVRASIVEKNSGFRPQFDGAQDYDFIFRCIEVGKEIHHIPKILYHWRMHKNSTAENPDSKLYAYEAGKRAIEAHLERVGVTGVVSKTKDMGFYKVRYHVTKEVTISIILSSKIYSEKIVTCILELTKIITYPNYEIILEVSENIIQKIEADLSQKEIDKSLVKMKSVTEAKGEYLVFIDPFMEVKTADFLEIFLGYCEQQHIGIVGGKVYDTSNKIVDAGYIIGGGYTDIKKFFKMDKKFSGYMHKASLAQNVSGVSFHLAMIRRELFQELGGYDREFCTHIGDIDLCLKARQMGYDLVYSPYVEACMLEDINLIELEENIEQEKIILKERYASVIAKMDPYYNVNLSLQKGNYSLKNPKGGLDE